METSLAKLMLALVLIWFLLLPGIHGEMVQCGLKKEEEKPVLYTLRSEPLTARNCTQNSSGIGAAYGPDICACRLVQCHMTVAQMMESEASDARDLKKDATNGKLWLHGPLELCRYNICSASGMP